MTDQLDDRAPISPAAFADGVLDEVLDLDDETRGRLIAAFTAAFAAHESSDGTVAFDAPYAVITARRR